MAAPANPKPVLLHGEGFTMIQDVIDIEIAGGKMTARAKMTYTGEEVWLAKDHFEGFLLLPAIIHLEAMAQTLCQIAQEMPELSDLFPVFASIIKANFREPVFPGQAVEYSAKIDRLFRKDGKIVSGIASAEARVDDKLVANASFIFGLKSKDEIKSP